MTKQIPWPRVFVEGAVIVGSILLAFGIDSWWQDVQDQRQEQAYLEQLLDDLYANQAVVAALNRQQTSQLYHARRIYPLVSRGDWADLDTASVVLSSYWASPSPTPTWVDDTFEEAQEHWEHRPDPRFSSPKRNA